MKTGKLNTWRTPVLSIDAQSHTAPTRVQNDSTIGSSFFFFYEMQRDLIFMSTE